MDGIGQVTAVAFVLLLLCGTLWFLRRRGLAGFDFVGFNLVDPDKEVLPFARL